MSLESPLSILLCNCSFIFMLCFSSHHSICPQLSLLLSQYICLSYLISHICQQTPILLSHIQMCTHWIGKHAYECKQPRLCIQKTIEEQTTSDAYFLTSRVVLSCTATHCVYAEPLSLLVERCYAQLTSGEENILSCPLVINNYPPLIVPPSTSHSHLCRVHTQRSQFNDYYVTQGINISKEIGHFLLMEKDQKWKLRFPDANEVPGILTRS